MKKAIKRITLGLFIDLVIIISVFTGLRMNDPHFTMKWIGYDFYEVSNTRSMEPLYKTHDLIIVKDFDFYQIKVGDIILFTGTNKEGVEIFISHQVIERLEEDGKVAYRTKGINLKSFDRRLVTIDGADYTNRYVGKVVYHNRPIGLAMAYLTSPFGIINFTSSVVILYLIVLVINYEEEKQESATS